MLSALKVTRFQPNFAIFFTHFFQHWKWNAFSLISPYFSWFFFHQQWKCYKIQIYPGNAEYFKQFKFYPSIFHVPVVQPIIQIYFLYILILIKPVVTDYIIKFFYYASGFQLDIIKIMSDKTTLAIKERKGYLLLGWVLSMDLTDL